QKPLLQHAIVHRNEFFSPDAFTIKRARGWPPAAERIIGYRDARGGDLLPHPVAKEAGLAGNCSTIDCGCKAACDAPRNTWIIHDRIDTRLDPPGVEALHRPLPSPAADRSCVL